MFGIRIVAASPTASVAEPRLFVAPPDGDRYPRRRCSAYTRFDSSRIRWWAAITGSTGVRRRANEATLSSFDSVSGLVGTVAEDIMTLRPSDVLAPAPVASEPFT